MQKIDVHVLVILPQHGNTLDLTENDIRRHQDPGAFHQVAAIGFAGFVAHADMHMQIDVALGVTADDAAGAGQLNRVVQRQHAAITIAAFFLRKRLYIAEAHTGETADRADHHTVVDPVALTGSLHPTQKICAGGQPDHDDPPETPLRSTDLLIHSDTPYRFS